MNSKLSQNLDGTMEDMEPLCKEVWEKCYLKAHSDKSKIDKITTFDQATHANSEVGDFLIKEVEN